MVPGRPLRILHAVEFYDPSRGGAQEVVRRISEAMVTAGHEVTVATTRLEDRATKSVRGVRIEQFEIAGNAVRGIRGEAYAYQRFLIEEPFDVVMTYAAQQWTTDLMLEVADQVGAVKLCAPCGYSALRDPSYREYFRRLPDQLRKLDATIYHSNGYQDIEFARAHGLAGVHVIPNGASAAEFSVLDRAAASSVMRRYGVSGRLVLSVGSHTGLKGHRATLAAFALARTGPATLIINGDGRPGAGCERSCRQLAARLQPLLRAQRKRALLLDLDRDELVCAYQAADVFMLLSRCECSPVVLFEAAASGTPFVSADIGNAREIAAWTGAGVVLDPAARPWHAGRALSGLLLDCERCAAMARDGRDAWRRGFTWEAIAQSYLALYQSLVGLRASGARR